MIFYFNIENMALQVVKYCESFEIICGKSLVLDSHFNPKLDSGYEIFLHFGITILVLISLLLFILFIVHYLSIVENCSSKTNLNCEIPVLDGKL